VRRTWLVITLAFTLLLPAEWAVLSVLTVREIVRQAGLDWLHRSKTDDPEPELLQQTTPAQEWDNQCQEGDIAVMLPGGTDHSHACDSRSI
jgi:hypothetical protein